MKHLVDLTGDCQTTVYDAARRLLSEGANPADTVEARRGGVASMSGKIGELAKWTVVFAAAGMRLKPFLGCPTARVTAEMEICDGR
jgi:hypothetical protein